MDEIYIAGYMETSYYEEMRKRKDVKEFKHRLESYYYVRTCIEKSKQQLKMYEGAGNENK